MLEFLYSSVANLISIRLFSSLLRHIAKEGCVFVIGCGMALRTDDIPESHALKQLFPAKTGTWQPGDSGVVNPTGEFIVGPVREREALLYADIDLRQVSEPKWMLNVAGHDARPDIFQLIVHREPYQVIRTMEALTMHERESRPL